MENGNIIPAMVLQNVNEHATNVCSEFYNVIAGKINIRHLYDNLTYFKNTFSFLEKETAKQVAVYKHMQVITATFVRHNPYAILDLLLLYSKSLIDLLEQVEDSEHMQFCAQRGNIEAVIQDLSRVLTYMCDTNIKDGRVANFYLLNQTIH